MPNVPPLSPLSWPAWAKATLDRLLTGRATMLDLLWAEPERLMSRANMQPDVWQTRLLRSSAPRQLVLNSRQAGKSQTAACMALSTALTMPGSLTLLLSPTLRQSGELFRDKVCRLYEA